MGFNSGFKGLTAPCSATSLPSAMATVLPWVAARTWPEHTHNSISDLANEKGKHLEKIYGSCYPWNALTCQVRLAQQRKSTITPCSAQFTLGQTLWHHHISSIRCRSSTKSPCLKATWDSSISTATRPHAGRQWKCSTARQGKRFLSSPHVQIGSGAHPGS